MKRPRRIVVPKKQRDTGYQEGVKASLGSMQDTGCSGLVHWDDPEGWYGEGGGRRGSGWGTHVHPWWIHVDVWQNQYNTVK